MKIDKIQKEFKSSGISLVKVMEFDTPDETTMTFDGELSEYVEAVNNLGSQVIFISIGTLPEEAFIMNIGDEIDEYDLIPEEIDLSSINKSFNKYKKHIGENAYFHLLATSQYGSLQFNMQEKWFDEFYELLETEREKIKSSCLEEIEESENHERSKQNELLKIIPSLKNDENFCKCKTQIIKMAYALEKHPELKDLDSATLKVAIANITATLEVRKMRP